MQSTNAGPTADQLLVPEGVLLLLRLQSPLQHGAHCVHLQTQGPPTSSTCEAVSMLKPCCAAPSPYGTVLLGTLGKHNVQHGNLEVWRACYLQRLCAIPLL
jgi:hypothetical protein